MTSTYGRPALEQLREVVRIAKADDAMATVTILLPNNIAGIVARRYLAREGLDEQRRGIAIPDPQTPSHRSDRVRRLARDL